MKWIGKDPLTVPKKVLLTSSGTPQKLMIDQMHADIVGDEGINDMMPIALSERSQHRWKPMFEKSLTWIRWCVYYCLTDAWICTCVYLPLESMNQGVFMCSSEAWIRDQYVWEPISRHRCAGGSRHRGRWGYEWDAHAKSGGVRGMAGDGRGEWYSPVSWLFDPCQDLDTVGSTLLILWRWVARFCLQNLFI